MFRRNLLSMHRLYVLDTNCESRFAESNTNSDDSLNAAQ